MNETETPPITLITCDDWKTIPKEVSYKLYVDLYKLYLEKEKFMTRHSDAMFKIDPSFAIVKCNQMIKSLPSTNPKIRQYNKIYQDNLHLKYKSGFPMFNNAMNEDRK